MNRRAPRRSPSRRGACTVTRAARPPSPGAAPPAGAGAGASPGHHLVEELGVDGQWAVGTGCVEQDPGGRVRAGPVEGAGVLPDERSGNRPAPYGCWVETVTAMSSSQSDEWGSASATSYRPQRDTRSSRRFWRVKGARCLNDPACAPDMGRPPQPEKDSGLGERSSPSAPCRGVTHQPVGQTQSGPGTRRRGICRLLGGRTVL